MRIGFSFFEFCDGTFLNEKGISGIRMGPEWMEIPECGLSKEMTG